jgi:hypothetical protein
MGEELTALAVLEAGCNADLEPNSLIKYLVVQIYLIVAQIIILAFNK